MLTAQTWKSKEYMAGRNTYTGHMLDTARHNVTIDHAVQHAEHQAVDTYMDVVAVN
jgi:hypothetical protein